MSVVCSLVYAHNEIDGVEMGWQCIKEHKEVEQKDRKMTGKISKVIAVIHQRVWSSLVF